jgi:cobalt-precorrin 5A hydrolase / cobalt-factor III methyltransferase / precorrin-3B C17-methyltransferase
MTQVALIILGQHSTPVAKRIKTALPEAVLYGPADRTTGVDVPFTNFGATLRALFSAGTPVVGICAAGILIRTLAPLLSYKWQEPPVLAVAADGSSVVPLLGGLQGANDLARRIAGALQVNPAITTTGELRIPTTTSAHLTPSDFAVGAAPRALDPQPIGPGPGWLAIVGTGPGGEQWMSPEAKEVLQAATDWVGYTTYLNLAEPLRQGQQRHASDNREELARAAMALDLAAEGRAVALVSSGDPGIYAMAAAVFEVLERDAKPSWSHIDIRVCPGISAMQAAAAQVGAPLGHDFCVMSLSDILKPWTVIEQRLTAAAQADLVLVIYNPVSKQRTWQLQRTKEIVLQWRAPDTPVVLARNLGRPGQAVTIKPLDQLTAGDADMRTILVIGSRQTRTIRRSDGRSWVYTPRRYAESGSASEETD